MRPFRISQIGSPDNSAWRLYRTRDSIKTDPEYQRASDIWTTEKKQLLIDTLLNGFDVPKLYFHKFLAVQVENGREFEYAIVDGKQRLEAIWEFIEGKYSLSPDFECIWDPSMHAAGMTYAELSKLYPDLKIALDSYSLPVTCIETDDIEIIEDMFSRLNEAVPLSAAEKRNAKGGPIPVAIKALVASAFFQESIPFGNGRYRHFDMAAKFLMCTEFEKVLDTKKLTLDKYVQAWAKASDRNSVLPFYQATERILNRMSVIFTPRDKLLKQASAVILYFHLFRIADLDGWTDDLQRHALASFEQERTSNRLLAELGGEHDFDLIEYDRYAQSSNDAYAVKLRLRILARVVFGRELAIESL